MLTCRLQRAQLEIRFHRQWLQAFLGSARRPYATTSPALLQRDDLQGSQESRLLAEKPPVERKTGPPRKLKIRKQRGGGLRGYESVETLRPEPDESFKKLLRQRDSLRQAVAELRIHDVIKLYGELEDKSVFNRHDFRIIAQCLHTSVRGFVQRPEDPQERREETDGLVAFGERLVRDVTQGVIQPNPQAHLHLLGFLKEAGYRDPGLDFWRWLEDQDELYVSADVYGAAIELLAVTGSPLAQLEELYQNALLRFPNNFAAYHLSPDAILPNRDQAARLPGLPVLLLQGILTARLLHGDTRNAYLAMDTALRIFPDQTPARFFALFIEERPLEEAYAILAIACRAGIVLPVNLLKKFQTMLRQTSDMSSPLRHSLAIRAQLSLLYMYRGAGGKLTQNMLNELIISMTQFLRLQGVSSLETGQRQRLVKEIMEIVRQIIAIFARSRVVPGIAPFNSIISNLAGHGQSEEVIRVALADAQALGLKPNEVTRRSLLMAAGMLQLKELVFEHWLSITQARLNANKNPDSLDWYCFIQAAHKAGCVELARSEFEVFKERIAEDKHEHLQSQLNASDGDLSPSPGLASTLAVEAISIELQKIHKDLEIVDTQTKNSQGVQDFSSQKLPMTLLPPDNTFAVPEQVTRDLYDELTTEQVQTKPSENDDASSVEPEAVSSNPTPPVQGVFNRSAPHTTSPTAIPLGTLRHENWKTMNWLLEQSAANDQAYFKLVDKAIAAGAVPPERDTGSAIGRVEDAGTYGLSDALQTVDGSAAENNASNDEVQSWRSKILQLRAKQG